MDTLLALLAFLASLFGYGDRHDTVVHRITDGGVDRLLSRATLLEGSARFECLRSASGTCHYLVLPPRCLAPERCAERGRRFDVAAGASRQVAALSAFRLCVDGRLPIDARQCTGAAPPRR